MARPRIRRARALAAPAALLVAACAASAACAACAACRGSEGAPGEPALALPTLNAATLPEARPAPPWSRLPPLLEPLAAEQEPACATLRDVVVSDVLRVDGATLYYAEASQGLLVVDLSDAARPHAVGRVPMVGAPVALFVREGVAWLVANDTGSQTSKDGPRTIVRGVDVRDPRAPRLVGDQVRPGTARDAKLVGSVLHVLRGERAHTVVDSFGLRGGAVAALSSATLEGRPAQLAASPAGLAVVTALEDRVSVTWLDLSVERPGALAVRRTVTLPGGVATWEHGEGRIVDADEGQRVRLVTCATAACAASEGATLRVVDFGVQPRPLAPSALPLTARGGLPLTRFTDGLLYVTEAAPGGDDATLLHVVRTDERPPRFVSHLTLGGRLEALVPHDASLVALGSLGSADAQVRLIVHDLDLRLPETPRARAAVTFGSDWTWSVALREDQALSFDPSSSLVAIPFTAWRREDRRYVTGTQLVDLSRPSPEGATSLATDSAVERALFLDGRLVTLGPDGVASVDYAARHEPEVRERVLDLSARRRRAR